MIAHVCQSTGWTWDYVENELTLPRLDALSAYWRDYPPLHVMLAAFLGRQPARNANKGDLGELLALFGDGRIA